MDIKPVLTIAGSDCSGGAGIQADIKTMIMNGVYAMSAITALTAQNTLGVRSVFNVSPQFLADQLDAIFEDIPPQAVKIGMVSSKDLITVISQKLIHYNAKNIVVDPVMVATSGANLIDSDAIYFLANNLFPIAKIITPNIPELEFLSNKKIFSKSDMEFCAQKIFNNFGCAVLAKGGHSLNHADDLLFDGNFTWFNQNRINTKNTHGTGCTLSSAIAANLAKNFNLIDSVAKAKKFLTQSLNSNLNLGHGNGPINHLIIDQNFYL